VPGKLARVRAAALAAKSPSYLERLNGTIGAEPFIAEQKKKKGQGH